MAVTKAHTYGEAMLRILKKSAARAEFSVEDRERYAAQADILSAHIGVQWTPEDGFCASDQQK